MSAATSLRSVVQPTKCHHSTTIRAFSSSRTRHQIQPESPRFIEVPRPRQENYTPKPVVKGFLPVPREVFPGKLETEAQLHKSLYRTAQARRVCHENAQPGSREEWDLQLSSQRRRNLLEGSIELRLRKEVSRSKREARTKVKVAAREEALHQAIREDERLTMQSNNFDLEKLKAGRLDPGNARQVSIEAKNRHDEGEKLRHEEKVEHLHDLYNKARSFIVTKQQLDQAIEKTFGTDENPVTFSSQYSDGESSHSIWAYGRPDRVQDRLNVLQRRSSGQAQFGPSDARNADLLEARITRIAERLTGGSLGKSLLSEDSEAK